MESTVASGRRRYRSGNGESVREQARKVNSELHNLIGDVEDLLKKLANIGDAEVAKVRARVEKTLASAREAAGEGVSVVKDYARQATEVTDEYVHESPWTAVGLAAAVGVLIGYIAARR
jgi:ElaB/YqjD/DUF883 family membrane-anchored ribosome-binding protein